MARSSLEAAVEPSRDVRAAKELQAQFESSDLQLQKKVAELYAHKLEIDGVESEDGMHRDPAVVDSRVASQIASPSFIIVEVNLQITDSRICESLNFSTWSKMQRTDM